MALKIFYKSTKEDGQQYPPITIQYYLIGLQDYIRNQKDNALNFMVDVKFLNFHKLLTPFTTGSTYRDWLLHEENGGLDG